MTFHYIHTCRLCRQDARHYEAVRYGKRHYAHHACYLDAGKSLDDLPAHQVETFPWRLIKDRGLGPQVDRILAEADRRRQLVEAAIQRIRREA
jgi:hypothetical protein